MKTGEYIDKGTILVAIATQSTSCGINYINKGSIIKVAKDKNIYGEIFHVYRNKKAEDDDIRHSIYIENVRLANEKEIDMWNKEIYFVETVKTF